MAEIQAIKGLTLQRLALDRRTRLVLALIAVLFCTWRTVQGLSTGGMVEGEEYQIINGQLKHWLFFGGLFGPLIIGILLGKLAPKYNVWSILVGGLVHIN